jgi:transcription termination factor NusB
MNMSGSRKSAAVVEDVSGDDIGEDVWDGGGENFLENDDNPAGEPDEDPEAAELEATEKEASDEDDGDQDQQDAEEVEEDDTTEEDDGEAVQPITPPSNWPQQEQVFFRSLPPQLQHAYMDRARAMVADYTNKTQQLAQVRRHYQEVDQVIAPRIKSWQLSGMSTGQALTQLLALSDLASEKPVEFIKYFSQVRGIDLNSLVGQPQGAAPEGQGYVDPQVAALQRELAKVQSTVSQTVTQQRQREEMARRAQVEAQQRNAEAVINQYASQVDQTGKPVYPYFNQLEGMIATLIQSGQARNIPDAYQIAVWAHPQTRQKMLARSKSEENAKARRQAEKARKSAVSVSGAHGSGNGRLKTDDLSINALMRAAARGEIA